MWAWVALVVLVIYGSLGLTGHIAEVLRSRGLLTASVSSGARGPGGGPTLVIGRANSVHLLALGIGARWA